MVTVTDLPPGYRWATEEECDPPHPQGIAVPRTADSTGRPYTQGEWDLAVPQMQEEAERTAWAIEHHIPTD